VTLRAAEDLMFRPQGLTDSLDGTNAPPGSMASLQNLCLSYSTDGVFVPRPAATTAIDFSVLGITGVVSAIITVGTRAYGWVASAQYPGHDEPFCYDFASSGFVTLTGVTAGLLPLSLATTGDWTPPVVCAVTNSWILFLHAGYAGGSGAYFGWLDISGYSTSVRANLTAGSAVLTGVVTVLGNSAPILQGVSPGQIATGSGLGGVYELAAESGALLGAESGPILGTEGEYAVVQSSANGVFNLNTTGTTASNVTVTGVANLTGVIPGMTVTGPAFAVGTYVTAITSTTVTLSQAAITTAAATSINFSGGGAIALASPSQISALYELISLAGGTYGAPLWGAGNFNTNPLTSVPIAVAGFNGRAYVGTGPYLVYSDVLKPLQVSLASQALIIGDNTPITAIASVPLTAQLTGGVQQSLTVFKAGGALTQITGDAANPSGGTPLTQNTVQGSVGTLAPNSIASTPYGLAFIAIDGLRVLGMSGTESEPIGTEGTGVVTPFLNALYPSRMCADYADDIYRVTVQNGAMPSQPISEYWFDFKTKKWTGPHTCAMRLIASYPNGQGFLGAPWAQAGKVLQSPVIPAVTSTYIEFGAQLTWTYQTSLLPDNHFGSFNKVMQTSLATAIRSSDTLQVSAIDERGVTLDSVSITGSAPGPSVWGSAIWGTSSWGAAASNLREFSVPWRVPIVFRQVTITVSSASAGGQSIGNFYAKVQKVKWNTPLS
jgi:hypothetical protein